MQGSNVAGAFSRWSQPEWYRAFRRPHFFGAAVRRGAPTPEIEETGMLSRQAAVESRRRPGTEADPSTVAVGVHY